MSSGPSKTVEAIVALLIPPACREEVLGDLHERYNSPRQYGLDALRTIPLVIASRIRRTADAQVLLIQAFTLYVSFLCAAWLKDGALLSKRWGLLRLAIPGVMGILGLILDDTYARPGRRSTISLARGPVLGIGLALASQGMFWLGKDGLSVPRWVMFYGCAISLVLSSGVRMLFPPASNQLQGVSAPALWLKQAGGSIGNPDGSIRVAKGVTAVLAVAIVGRWLADRSALPNPRIVTQLLAVLVIAIWLWKRN